MEVKYWRPKPPISNFRPPIFNFSQNGGHNFPRWNRRWEVWKYTKNSVNLKFAFKIQYPISKLFFQNTLVPWPKNNWTSEAKLQSLISNYFQKFWIKTFTDTKTAMVVFIAQFSILWELCWTWPNTLAQDGSSLTILVISSLPCSSSVFPSTLTPPPLYNVEPN